MITLTLSFVEISKFE